MKLMTLSKIFNKPLLKKKDLKKTNWEESRRLQQEYLDTFLYQDELENENNHH